MSRKKFKRHGGEKFLAIYRHMYRTPAWQALKPNDRALYLALLTRYDGLNNGKIALSQRDAAKDMNVAKRQTAAASFAELEEKGFICQTVASGFNRKDRATAEYLLTAYRDDRSGASATKEYMKWRPPEKTTGTKNGGHRYEKRTRTPERECKIASTGAKTGPVEPVLASSSGTKNGPHIDIHHVGGANGHADAPHHPSADTIPIHRTNGPRPRPPATTTGGRGVTRSQRKKEGGTCDDR